MLGLSVPLRGEFRVGGSVADVTTFRKCMTDEYQFHEG